MCGKNLSTNQEHFPTALVIVIVPRYLAKKDNHLRKIKLRVYLGAQAKQGLPISGIGSMLLFSRKYFPRTAPKFECL